MRWRGEAILRTGRVSTVAVVLLSATGLLLVPAPGLAQMPDLRSMSGQALPDAGLPAGTVTVRVVRGAITNNVTGVQVELHTREGVRTATTGPDGRAQFSGLAPGAAVRAVATVDGERIESAAFEVPARGGVRTLLAAGTGGAAPQGSGPAPGAPTGSVGRLSLSPNSRIAVEFADDVLQVFYLLEVVNRSSGPVSPPGGLVFDLPDGAEGATVLDGSTPLATAAGDTVTLAGPIPPGATPLQIGFRIDSFGETLTLEQPFPLPFEMVVVAVQKAGGLALASPHLARTQEVPIQNNTYIMGTGPALAAGTPLVLSLEGLPHHSRLPVWLTLAVAGVVIGWGAWLAWSPASSAAGDRRRWLQARRAEGLSALAALEEARRAGAVADGEYAARRTALLSALEGVYAELDEPAARDVA